MRDNGGMGRELNEVMGYRGNILSSFSNTAEMLLSQ
jgi:hypothetical protein